MQHEKRIANPNAKRPFVQDRDHDGLIVAAWQQGWWCEQGKKHVKCFPPDTSKNAVIVPSTPSDYRSIKNVRSRMRLSGLTI